MEYIIKDKGEPDTAGNCHKHIICSDSNTFKEMLDNFDNLFRKKMPF